MSLKVVLATGTMSESGWRDALAHAFDASGVKCDVDVWNGKSNGARYAVVWLPPAELFAAEPNLRAVFNLGAGVDAMLARGMVPAQLPILRLVDAGMAPKIAEYVCFAIARITRGLERFGAPPAESVMRFGYPVAGWSRRLRAIGGIESFAGAAQLDAFLARTHVLVNALPLTPHTENLLDRNAFARVPRGAHVINVGRGGTIVDADLLAALDDGQLASATLDVFRVEPLPANHPFWSHPKVTVTPHLSGPTPYGPAAEQIAQALLQLEHGVEARDLPGFVDRAAGY